MSRPIEYKREEVLEAATHVFWKKGFNSTSMNDLVEATGLNKHSMYGEFKSKEGLFLACIDNYVNKSTKSIADILAEKPLGIRNIKAFFENRIEYASSGECDGCLLVNTAVEGKTLNDKLNKIVNKWMKKLITVATPFQGTSNHIFRYFQGEDFLNTFYGKRNICKMAGTMYGSYILMFNDLESYKHNKEVLSGSPNEYPGDFPSRDHKTKEHIDPYDPSSNVNFFSKRSLNL